MPNVGDVIYATEHARMGCTLRRVATQTLNDAATTAIVWDTETADTHNLWTSGASITIPATGLWAITATFAIAAATTARTFIEIVVASLPSGPYWRVSVGPNSEDTGAVSAVLPLVENETFVINAFRDSAAGTTMTARVDCYRVSL